MRQLTEIDPAHVVALVATHDGKLIGGGRYVRDEQHNSAELAFVTGVDYRGRGLASLLLKHLVHLGREQRLQLFEADVLMRNIAMLNVFRRSGLRMQTQTAGDVVHVKLSLGEV